MIAAGSMIPMSRTNMDLSALPAKHDQGDLPLGITELGLQLNMATDMEGIIGAGRHERSGKHATLRNEYRERVLDTRLTKLNRGCRSSGRTATFRGFLEAGKTPSRHWWW